MSPERRKISPFLRQCVVSLGVGCTTLGHGCMTALPAVLLAQLHELRGAQVTTDHISWASSMLSPTMPLGAILVSPVMARLGRKAAHLAVTLPALVAWLMIAFADTFTLIVIGRILQGLSLGMMMPLRSTLVGEYTSPKNRAAFLGTISLAQGFGVLAVHLMGSFFYWRTTCLLCALFHVLSLVIIYFTPESPSWLADREKFEQCRKTFKLLRGDDDDKELDKLIKAKITVYNTEKIKNLSDVVRVIRKREFYKPVILMSHAYMGGECSGSSIVAIYSSIMLSIVVSPNIDVKFWMLMLDINRILSSMFQIYIARKIKRKVLMFSTSSICIVSYLVIAGYMCMRSLCILNDNVWVPLVLVHVAYVSMVFVLGVPYIIAGEIFPLQYRSVGGSISVVFLSATYFGVVKTFPDLVSTIGLEYTYVIYAGILMYCLIVGSVLLPETKDKTLLQIEEEFRGKSANETVAQDDEMITSRDPCDQLLVVSTDHSRLQSTV